MCNACSCTEITIIHHVSLPRLKIWGEQIINTKLSREPAKHPASLI